MRDVLFSIHPQYANAILDGVKCFEYRTKGADLAGNRMYIYSTKPDGMVLGRVDIVRVISDTPDEMWAKTRDFSGMRKEDFDAYFRGRATAYAYILENPHRFKEPKSLDFYGIQSPPQSWYYFDTAQERAAITREALARLYA